MKYLAVIRHAKSSWDNPEWTDFQRPLNTRGLNDTKIIATQLTQNKILPDFVVCSNAQRTTETLNILNTAWHLPPSKIEITNNLYLATHLQHLKSLSKVDNQYNFVADIAHNPGVTDLVNYLCGENLSHFPTCGVAIIELQISSWQEISAGTGILQTFIYPKLFK